MRRFLSDYGLGVVLGVIFAVTMLIATYFQLAHVIAALDLETEEPFVGWEVGPS